MTEFHRGAIADPAGAARTIVEGLRRGGNYDLVDTERPPVPDQQHVA